MDLVFAGEHPRVAHNLMDELAAVLRGDAPSIDQFGQLVLLDSVIKESLRLLPPVLYNTRTAVKACELGPYRLDAGRTVGFSHYVTHHSPKSSRAGKI